MAKEIISVQGTQINIFTEDHKNDYISLTDIAKYKNPEEPKVVVSNWLRNRNTIEFLGIWEELNNPNFKGIEFESFKKDAGLNSFTLSAKKWIESTNAIGIISKPGRYGGTYAHTDIAFEFASWVSAEFKLYIIKEYQRLKTNENNRLNLDWNLNRELAKLNFRIHTDAVKEFIIHKLDFNKQKYVYASEADLLNLALFGITAKEWRQQNPNLDGNIRDYASIEQLLVLSNLENYNSILIEQGLSDKERLKILNKFARTQLTKLINNNTKSLQQIKQLKNEPNKD